MRPGSRISSFFFVLIVCCQDEFADVSKDGHLRSLALLKVFNWIMLLKVFNMDYWLRMFARNSPPGSGLWYVCFYLKLFLTKIQAGIRWPRWSILLIHANLVASKWSLHSCQSDLDTNASYIIHAPTCMHLGCMHASYMQLGLWADPSLAIWNLFFYTSSHSQYFCL